MMKNNDALLIPFNDYGELIITSDNSGAIGLKKLDEVKVPYEVVGYFAFRVAYMDCVAAGGEPLSVIVMNFNGDEAWVPLQRGINQALEQLEMIHLPMTGSTESNFTLQQSATAITMIGKMSKPTISEKITVDDRIAIIGKPLVGNEVIDNEVDIAPLSLFQWCSKQDEILTIIPVGSKGIANEFANKFPGINVSFSKEINVEKSSGPSTCFIIIYKKEFHPVIKEKAKKWLHIATKN